MLISKKWLLPGVGLAAVALVLWDPWAEGGSESKAPLDPDGALVSKVVEPSSIPTDSPGPASSAERAELVPKPASAQSAHDSHKEQAAFWWDDPEQYEAYVQLFYRRASGQELGILGPEAKLERLRALDETMANGKHDFLTGVNWAELGEFEDGRDVAFVLRAVREMEDHDLDKLRLSSEMIHSFCL
jgi:hypothetical protein